MREELQQQDVERWLGFITFLCEVFGTMRSSTGEPFRVLVCPIYTCLREVRRPALRAGTAMSVMETQLRGPGKAEGCTVTKWWSLGKQQHHPPHFHLLKPGFYLLSLQKGK